MKPRSRFRGLTLFVTVGSTRFDKLINKILTEEVIEQLVELGFIQLVIQAGSSEVDLENVESLKEKIEINLFDYKPSLLEDIKAADVVVGHAGSGTCLEVLRLKKRLLIVVNDTLMDNHQVELAEELTSQNFGLMTNVDDLQENIKLIHTKKFSQFPPQKDSKFEEILDEMLLKLNNET